MKKQSLFISMLLALLFVPSAMTAEVKTFTPNGYNVKFTFDTEALTLDISGTGACPGAFYASKSNDVVNILYNDWQLDNQTLNSITIGEGITNFEFDCLSQIKTKILKPQSNAVPEITADTVLVTNNEMADAYYYYVNSNYKNSYRGKIMLSNTNYIYNPEKDDALDYYASVDFTSDQD